MSERDRLDTAAPPEAGPSAERGTDWSATPVVRVSKRNVWLALAAGLALLLLGVWLVISQLPRLLSSQTGTAAAPTGTSGTTDARKIQVTLFYVSDDGSGLVATRGEALYAGSPSEQARRIIEAAVQPPPADRQSAIPNGTTVRAVFLTPGGQAYVDLGGTFVSGHSGGSLDEALAVYAIVNALTANLPNVSAVQILIDGRQVDTLAGHLDLRYPLGKSSDWVRKGP